MKQGRRLAFYLLLNFLVSACATLSVLVIWDQFYSPLPRGVLPGALERISVTTTPSPPPVADRPQATPTETYIIHQVRAGDTFESIAEMYGVSVGDILAANGFTRSQPLGAGEVLRIPQQPGSGIEIVNVIGPGDLENERVLLEHNGANEVSLVGWRLEDGTGQAFFFPEFPQLTLFSGGAVNGSERGSDRCQTLWACAFGCRSRRSRRR